MAKWNEYGLKSGTSAEDEVLILDSDTNTNKRITVGDIQEFANGKVLEKENSTLNTEAKTLIGAINEVDAKNDAQDTKIEEVENKFSDYLKNTDVDRTLSVSGSPADAKVVGEQFRKSEEAITDLADKKITKFYASNQGNTHLPDSGKGKIQDMFLYGKSEQAQYKGKNLWDNFKILSEGNVEQKNGTYIATTNTMKVDAEPNSTGARPLLLKANNTYTFSFKTTVSISKRKYICLKYTNGETKNILFENKNNVNFVPERDVEKIGFVLYESVVGDKAYDFQLENGSEVTPYEPYTGGIPSPNPDYPQEIKAVVNPKVIVMGKNLLDCRSTLSKTNSGISFVNNKDGSFSISGKNTQNWNGFDIDIMVYQSGTYKAFRGVNSSIPKVSIYDIVNKEFVAMLTDSGTTFQLEKGKKYIYTIAITDKVSHIDVTFKPFLTVDVTDTYEDYEPYTEQFTTLPYTLYAIPVSSGGNITIGGQQYVADYVDVERGKLVRMCKYKKLLSTDVNIIGSDNTSLLIFTDEIWDGEGNYTKRSLNALCSIGIATLETVADSGWGGKGKFKIKNAQFTNIDEAINYFNNHDVYACYPIPTQEEIDLTQEQIQAFKSLATNYPVTNIEVSSDQLDGHTVFNYPISMAEGWNYVKQQIGDTRDYIYDMDLQSAEAYVNSEYAVALTELEVM